MNDKRRRKLGSLLDEKQGKVGAPSTVVRFPRAVKRGAKVTRGPCAEILPFQVQLSGEELESQYRWICSNEGDWKNEKTEGAEHISDEEREILELARTCLGWKKPSDIRKRQRIAKGRKVIEKRNAVKAWLASLGVDVDNIKDAEQALFAAFDKLA